MKPGTKTIIRRMRPFIFLTMYYGICFFLFLLRYSSGDGPATMHDAIMEGLISALISSIAGVVFILVFVFMYTKANGNNKNIHHIYGPNL